MTSSKEILNRANVGQGSMHHHFPGKRDLAATALERSTAAMRAEAEALLAVDGASIERVISYLGRQRGSPRSCRIGYMTYGADMLAAPELLHLVAETPGWIADVLADVVCQGIEAGKFRYETDPEQLASTVVATAQGGYVLTRTQQSPTAFGAAVAGTVSFIRQQAGD